MRKEKLEKQRLINAIKLISEEVQELSVMKLNKLLFFFDLQSFCKTGHTATGSWYFTEENGPAPKLLNTKIINNESSFFMNELSFSTSDSSDYSNPLEIETMSPMNEIYFSDFQLNELSEVIKQYGHLSAAELSELTHEKGSVYSITLSKDGLNKPISFIPSLDNSTDITEEFVTEELGYSIDEAV